MTVSRPATRREPVDLVLDAPDQAPLSSVADALSRAAGVEDALYAGEQALSPDSMLGVAPLLDGVLITVGQPGPAVKPPPSQLELRVIGGPAAGGVHLLDPGETRLGRGTAAEVHLDDPDVSRLHALVAVSPRAVTVADLGSTNGTRLDGLAVGAQAVPLRPEAMLRVGESSLVLIIPAEPPAAVHPDVVGHLDLNRPPRLHPPVPKIELPVPAEPKPRAGMRVPILAALLPLPIGIAMVLITKQIGFGLFMLLSPVLVIGNALSDRLSGRREYQKDHAKYLVDKVDFDQRLAQALASEVALRRGASFDAAALLLTALTPHPRLWERRTDDDDALSLRVGTADLPAAITLTHQDPGAPPEHPPASAVPVTIGLRDVGVLGIAGPRPRVEGLARFVLAQLAGLHSPRNLDLVLLCDPLAPAGVVWEWARYLPHLSSRPGEDCTARVGLDDEQVAKRVAELVATLDARTEALTMTGLPRAWPGPYTVIVLDGARALRTVPGVARLLEQGPRVGIYAVCVADDVLVLPAECAATVVVTGDTGTRLRVTRTGYAPILDATGDFVSLGWAQRFARALCPIRDATPDGSGGSIPAAARLLDLLSMDPPTAEAIAGGWARGGRSTTAMLGIGAEGPYAIDLRRDGPHGLIAGTTGAGKSELLQTLLASLAVANRPDELTFVLVDYKGGSAFKDCAHLPHTVGMVTDLDGHLTARALASLDAELKRREHLLKHAGCKDIEDYQQAADRGAPLATMPRLVMVIDEFAAMVAELPDFIDGLVDIGRRGRSLGVHLILATQRPGGVVSADIRANTNLRIALRVTDAAESLDVVEAKDAALISKHTPGRAYCRSGARELVQFQSARVGGRRQAQAVRRATVVPAPWQRVGDPPPQAAAGGDEEGPSDLARLVTAICAANDRLGVPRVPSPWLPPLPDMVALAQLAPSGPLSVPIGLMDLPTQQARAPFEMELEHGSHLLVAGGPRSGRTTLLRTVAGAIANQCPVSDVHVYAYDCASGGLLPLAALPHVGAVVRRDDTARGDQVLARLMAEVVRRQELVGQAGYGSIAEQRASVRKEERLPFLVLLLDGWDGFTQAYDNVDHGRPVDTMLRLLREGPSVGLLAVVAGDRSALTGRLSSIMPSRLLLRMPDPTDYSLGGLTAKQVPDKLAPGRGLIPGDVATEMQVALLTQEASGPAQVAELTRIAGQSARRCAGVACEPRPFRVEPLPTRVAYDDVAAQIVQEKPPLWALIGVGGDELEPVGIDLAEEGPAFVVAGPSRSGRSTALLTMARWWTAHGTRVAVVTARRSPLRDLKGQDNVVGVFGPAEAGELKEALSLEDGPVAILVDDGEALLDSSIEQTLIDIIAAGADRPWVMVVAGAIEEMASSYRGLTVEARKGKTGLLISPTGPMDGDLLGVKLTRGLAPRPGGGVLAVKGLASSVQVAQ